MPRFFLVAILKLYSLSFSFQAANLTLRSRSPWKSVMVITSLPSYLSNTTELKLKDSYQWQPLQTFVAISKHFTLRAKGVRFRGTLTDCNTAMQQLLFQVSDFKSLYANTLVISLTCYLLHRVTDMGQF